MDSASGANRGAGATEDALAPKPIRHFRALFLRGYAVTALACFVILAVSARSVDFYALDVRVSHAVQSVASRWLTLLMSAVSYPGYFPQSYILVAVITVGMFAVGLRWEAISALLGSAGSSTMDALLKVIIHRPRPGADLVHIMARTSSYSFPSGHVVVYTVFYGFLFYLSWTLVRQRAVRILLCGALGSLVLLVGISRIYLGAHWLSDVVAGYLLGSLWLALTIHLYRWGKPRFFIQHRPTTVTGT
jgi:membrane-associated phospholipid phosphatase